MVMILCMIYNFGFFGYCLDVFFMLFMDMLIDDVVVFLILFVYDNLIVC